ncbi:hypothetical protein FOQG_16613 [Fusarium oxysporum f. sp. raphani 54005]|uniref:Uncharacterized protein n=1 Tax=Fusarium oxysporum f. sp. raphani 54005 TaxID=1089458 RepID=X0BIP4_FUSOX|nr:hypothetical protein FOQG_16613 [Fusarium oxysporum f. sp. raphani 54005]
MSSCHGTPCRSSERSWPSSHTALTRIIPTYETIVPSRRTLLPAPAEYWQKLGPGLPRQCSGGLLFRYASAPTVLPRISPFYAATIRDGSYGGFGNLFGKASTHAISRSCPFVICLDR